MKVYLLSDKAKAVTWQQWKKMGGCGLSDGAERAVSRAFHAPLKVVYGATPRNKLFPSAPPKTTLGQIQDACVLAGREMARFGHENLGLQDWAVVEYDN